MTLRIRIPLRITRHDESFGIRDGIGTHVASIYFSETEERQQQTKRLSREDAEEVAKVVARAVTERVRDDGI